MGIGYDEDDGEAFYTIDGKYRGVLADRRVMKETVLQRVLRGESANGTK